MKTTNSRNTTTIDEKDMKESFDDQNETVECTLKSNIPCSTFTIVDLWRVHKKHKSLGSSVRW